MAYVINLATHKRYNMQHAHHKHESFTQRIRNAFKTWRHKHSNRTDR